MQKRTATGKPPAYLHHRAKDRGFAYYRDERGTRRRRYFPGPHGSPESRRAYLDFLREWEKGELGETATSSPANDERLTVGKVVAAFLDWADTYYVKYGEPTGEADNHRFAVEQLVELFGDTPAAEFGPKRLRAVRDAMERSGRLSRRTVNHRIGRVRHVFKWAIAEEMVPGNVYQVLRALPALQPGRSKAREKDPVEPAPEEQIEAVLPFLTPTWLTCRCS